MSRQCNCASCVAIRSQKQSQETADVSIVTVAALIRFFIHNMDAARVRLDEAAECRSLSPETRCLARQVADVLEV